MIGDRYRILGLLGEGGMGRVYAAEHAVLRRKVALKLLRRDAAAEPEALARFRQEALAASRIGAPEIVEVVDFATHVIAGTSQTYMVMELLAGESLEAWMDRPARLDEALTILASLCDGLAAAHRADVVHRDIKPANVFLPAADPTLATPIRVKILDFGIAKITAGGEGFQTRQGSLLGTPYYLAPERVMGAELTGAADVYSVGVILYELLTGNVPFVADSFMGILANHVHTVPLDPRQAAPDRAIPAEVARVCLRLLAKHASERPSADAVAAELRALLAHDRAGIAAVATGPRVGAPSGGDTQILSEATQALVADPGTPTAVLGSPGIGGGGRSATQIGHGSAAVEGAPSSAEVLAGDPVLLTPTRAPARSRVLAGVLGAALLGAGAIALGLSLVAREPVAGEPVAGEPLEPPSPSMSPSTSPSTGPDPSPRARASEADALAEPARVTQVTSPEPVAGPEATASAAESSREPASEPAPASRKRREPEASPSKPAPASEPEPAPTPKPDPKPANEPNEPTPQPDPPAPTPEPKLDPGSDLPTIKDDVYD
jgi:eukaryotic-like serine/threonine-protein kinase